jgi:hypothetical protein
MTRPISNLPELPRGVTMGHIAHESINLGRKRLTVRPKADKHTPCALFKYHCGFIATDHEPAAFTHPCNNNNFLLFQ